MSRSGERWATGTGEGGVLRFAWTFPVRERAGFGAAVDTPVPTRSLRDEESGILAAVDDSDAPLRRKTTREGDVTDATVTAVHDFGIEIEVDGEHGFIQPVEMDWDPERSASANLRVGQVIRVLVLATTPSRFFASPKRACPDLDPWRDPEKFCVGSRHPGTVVSVVEWGYEVKLAAGVSGMRLSAPDGDRFHVGDQVVIEVGSVDPDLRKIEVTSMTPTVEKSERFGTS